MKHETRRLLSQWGCSSEELDEIAWMGGIDIELDLVILATTNAIHRKVVKLMTDLSALEAAVTKISEVDQNAAQTLDALRAEVANLTAGEISQEQIDSLANNLNAASTALAEAVTPPAPPAPPAE